MENVVDMLKFVEGYLGRYAVGRLVKMNNQRRMGMMVAGSYGLAQFRMRLFLWGAQSSKSLPQFPLPTHDVDIREGMPVKFHGNIVAYDQNNDVELEGKIVLEDVITDLPVVTNHETRDEMPYGKDHESSFQRFIRLKKDEMISSSSTKDVLFDHHPLNLNDDDSERVSMIPRRRERTLETYLV
ncbi:unnamed protein product [Arabis nemorensis]|uniref:Uncharacterized protein n=1 Tax=Arabis nemorensis TaxID=586526 RepID=A0A565C6F1_9BRAS|nr:unnamed protein product [Arabis nemorensis]